MGLFSSRRASRSDDRELGRALWRSDHDRFRRAVDRFHQVLEGVEDDAIYERLLPQADRLGELVERVRAVCAAAQKAIPVEGDDIPAAAEPAHRALSRAAHDAATAAQAAAMSRFSADPQAMDATLATVKRRIDTVERRVGEAESAAR